MNGAENPPAVLWWKAPLRWWVLHFAQREDRVLLFLSILIGALTGLAVVAFIVLTERLGMRLYPVGSAAWRRVLIPIVGSLAMGYLLFRYFPDARGSGVPQTKAALFARDGVIALRTLLGKFFCTSATLASGIPLGREGPSAQVGAGLASAVGRRLQVLVSTCRRGPCGRDDSLAPSASLGSRLRVRWRCLKRQNGPSNDGLVGCLQTSSRDDKLCFGQRRRHFWPQPVYWSDVGGRAWKRGASFLTGGYSGAWRLRPSRHGRAFFRDRARPYAVRPHHF